MVQKIVLTYCIRQGMRSINFHSILMKIKNCRPPVELFLVDLRGEAGQAYYEQLMEEWGHILGPASIQAWQAAQAVDQEV